MESTGKAGISCVSNK